MEVGWGLIGRFNLNFLDKVHHMASKLYGVDATIIIFVFVLLYCIVYFEGWLRNLGFLRVFNYFLRGLKVLFGFANRFEKMGGRIGEWRLIG